MHSIKSKAPRVLLSTIAALGLAVLPLVPQLARAPIAYADFDIMVSDNTMVVSESGASPDTFNVKLSHVPSSDVSIRVVNPDSGEVSVSPMELKFTTSNWSTEQPVTVTGVDDSQIDGTQSTTIRLEVIDDQSPQQYDGKFATVLATTMDNDSGFIVNKQSVTVSESGTTEDFTVRLSRQPSGTVVIKVTSDDSGEATVSQSPLVFTSSNWDTAQSVRVTGADDSSTDGSQTTDIMVAIDAAATTDDSFDTFPVQQVVATTTDNESSAGFTISESNSATQMTEGQTDTFTVVLTKQPGSSDVVVSVTSSNAEASVSQSQLRFTRDNWNVAQTVTVTGTDDLVDDGDQTSTITLSVMDSQSDDEFDSLSDRNIGVTVMDNDPAIQVRPAALLPVNGAKIVGLGTELRWTQPAGARWFELRVTPRNNDGPGIHLIISDDNQVASASYTVQDPDFGSADANYVMLPDMTYSWQVRTAQGTSQPAEADWSAWSDSSTFETGNKSSNTITLMSPSNNGGVVSSMRPTLMWSNSDDDVFYYEVQVSRDSNFCASFGCPMLYWELRHGGVTSPLNSYTIPSSFPLEGSNTYFWRVRPRIQGDGTPAAWSAAASFRTP